MSVAMAIAISSQCGWGDFDEKEPVFPFDPVKSPFLLVCNVYVGSLAREIVKNCNTIAMSFRQFYGIIFFGPKEHAKGSQKSNRKRRKLNAYPSVYHPFGLSARQCFDGSHQHGLAGSGRGCARAHGRRAGGRSAGSDV